MKLTPARRRRDRAAAAAVLAVLFAFLYAVIAFASWLGLTLWLAAR